MSGRPEDGAFALFTVVLANKAAILPNGISFTDGAVVPFALEAAICTLSLKTPGTALPGVSTPALGLPIPTVGSPTPMNKVLVIYGGSSSIGSMTTQFAKAIGINVFAIAGNHNFEFCKQCGAAEVFDRNDSSIVAKVVEAIAKSNNEFIGIFDAIGTPGTYDNDLAILAKLGGGYLASVHPPPANVPSDVKAGMIFAVNDIATPVWRDYVTIALENGQLQCLPPPTIVGSGLDSIQDALRMSKKGISATKLVVKL